MPPRTIRVSSSDGSESKIANVSDKTLTVTYSDETVGEIDCKNYFFLRIAYSNGWFDDIPLREKTTEALPDAMEFSGFGIGQWHLHSTKVDRPIAVAQILSRSIVFVWWPGSTTNPGGTSPPEPLYLEESYLTWGTSYGVTRLILYIRAPTTMSCYTITTTKTLVTFTDGSTKTVVFETHFQ
jgi:hypothetical protein